MIRQYKLVLLLSLLYLSISCSHHVPMRVRRNFNFCYSQTKDYSGSKVKLTGYYVSSETFEWSHYDIKTGKRVSSTLDTTYNNMKFFPDGIVALGFIGLNCGNCDIDSNSQFLIAVSQNKLSETEAFYNGFNWGIYKIDGDTIKLQCVNHQYWPNPYWHLFEHWFLINADGSLLPIYSKDLIDNKILKEKPIKCTYKFIENNLQLPSETWLKKKKWFWCNKQDYKLYMKKHKK